MAVYQDKARERIKAGVRNVRSHCNAGIKKNMGEADTRSIVREVLVDLLGWDEYEDVTQEEAIKGGYCDFLVRYQGKPYFIIEVKKISGNLRVEHLRQASHYAQDKAMEWVILTNGDIWEVHHLSYRRKRGGNPEPELFFVFDTSFTNTDIKPDDRVEFLYLLSKEARRNDELKGYLNLIEALSPQELTKRILQKDVIDRIRIGIKNDIGLRIDNAEIAARIVGGIVKESAMPSNASYYIKKLMDK